MPKGICFDFEDWHLVRIHGEANAAKDFLHRITSADFKNLKPGQHTAGTLLNAMGKMLLYFEAYLENDTYWLAVPPGLAADPAAEFEKLHFIEKLAIESVKKDFRFHRILSEAGAPFETVPGLLLFPIQQWTQEHWPTALRAAKARFTPTQDWGVIAPASWRAKDLEKSHSDFYRIAAFQPAAGHELTNTTIPLEAGLTQAVAENKGCYPGQETIERIRAMGHTPRMLARVLGKGDLPQTGSPLPGVGYGTFTSLSLLPEDLKTQSSYDWIGLGYVRHGTAAPFPEMDFISTGDSHK